MGYQTIGQPLLSFFGSDGLPLENGNIYVGKANLNPETNPVSVYWDSALTQPCPQPVKTSGGYPVRNGTPSRIYIDQALGAYSITVRDKNGALVYNRPESDFIIYDANVSTIAQQVAADAASASNSANTATAQAVIATNAATSAQGYANSALSSATIAAAYGNMEWANFSLNDGDLIVGYTSGATSVPSLVDGEFIITY